MEYLAGNLEGENNPIEIAIWDQVCLMADGYDGIMGYRIPSLGERSNENIPSFILRGQFGIIIIDVVTEKIAGSDEENEYWETKEGEFIYSRELSINLYAQELGNRLKKNKELYDIRSGKWLSDIPVEKHILFSSNYADEIGRMKLVEGSASANTVASDEINEKLQTILHGKKEVITRKTADIIDSILDGSDVFGKTRRKKILDEPQNMNDYIKKSLNYTFKLDRTQRQVAMQIPPGPQRIRGLAGTGKTVILCMKAALAHKGSPDLKILFVFNTQSMYNHVKTTITEYYINETKTMPNWDNLNILHAWGGSGREGVYYNTARACGIKPKTYFNVNNHENPLDAVYTDLLVQAKSKIIPEYDIVLIDEAQDFSPSFFETIYYLTKPVDNTNKEKRIIWAYDEFQSLNELSIKEPKEMFGLKKDGSPNMADAALEGEYKGKIEKDFILSDSYRNPRINLMIAHGLALGIYSKYGKVPMKDRKDWIARGYKVHEPHKRFFHEKDKVKVERPEEFSRNILETLLKKDGKSDNDKELIQFKSFANVEAELNEVVTKIEWLITNQKVEPEEIIVINLDIKQSRSQFEYIRQQLDIHKIKAITPGYVEPNDAFKEKGFVTLSTAYRAKGNEANIVIILNVQRVITDSTFRMRNAVFVAITRSRGWCYLYGFGKETDDLKKEIQDISDDYPCFNFTFPSESDISRHLMILRADKNVEKADNQIEKLLADKVSKALLIEKLAQNTELLHEIEKLKKIN